MHLPESSLPTSRTAIRVLVVDDSELDRLVIASHLAGLGCTVFTAADGAEAVLRASEGFAVIFMDIVMPGLDGYEASRQIRKLEGATGQTPIVALTGHATQTDRVECLSAGMDLWLNKPAVREDLARALSRFSGWKAGSSPIETEAILDEPVVASLLERCAEHDSDFLHDVILQFRSSGDAALESALRDLRCGDLAGVRFAVEQVRDSAANVGALGLMDLTAQVLSADDESLKQRGSSWLDALASEVLRAVVALGARAPLRTHH